jgi:hypothetical protein
MAVTSSLVPLERVERRILLLRGQRVILDADLAELFGVSTGRMNEQVRRNLARFPADFMVKLTRVEAANLKSQFAISSLGHGGRRSLPLAFTEHGAIMVANVLNSPRAEAASVLVVRAFVRLRHLTETHGKIVEKLHELEQRVSGHDVAIQDIVTAIRRLMDPPAEKRRRRIGFHERR